MKNIYLLGFLLTFLKDIRQYCQLPKYKSKYKLEKVYFDWFTLMIIKSCCDLYRVYKKRKCNIL